MRNYDNLVLVQCRTVEVKKLLYVGTYTSGWFNAINLHRVQMNSHIPQRKEFSIREILSPMYMFIFIFYFLCLTFFTAWYFTGIYLPTR